MTDKIPQGFHTITPHITCKNATASIELYKKAFGAVEKDGPAMRDPKTGKVGHACLTIGNSKIFLADEMPGCAAPAGETSVGFYLYFEDADAAFKKAISGGCKEFMPVTDMFWGDRMGVVSDPDGYKWNVATHVREVSPAELEKGMKEMSEKHKAA